MKYGKGVSLSEKGLKIDGKEVPNTFRFREESQKDWLKRLYKELNISYPKFHKMDSFCQLGFLSAEYLMSSVKNMYPSHRVGMFFINRFSSINSDMAFYKSYSDSSSAIPSPSKFVYTLPNILMGELSIRHKMTGEHGFFIDSDFELEFIYLYVRSCFDNGRLDAAMIGSCEFTDNIAMCQFDWVLSAVQDDLKSYSLEEFRSRLPNVNE